VANLYQVEAIIPDLKLGGERILAIMPLFHVYGLTTVMNLVLHIRAEDTIALLCMAAFNLGEITGRLTMPQSVLQLWYMACNLDVTEPEQREVVERVFGDLSEVPLQDRLAVGLRELNTARTDS
jgi:hypothetical protein